MTETATRLLKVDEAALVLACSPRTVRRLASEGMLTAVRFGEHGHLRFRPDELEALIARSCERRTKAVA